MRNPGLLTMRGLSAFIGPSIPTMPLLWWRVRVRRFFVYLGAHGKIHSKAPIFADSDHESSASGAMRTPTVGHSHSRTARNAESCPQMASNAPSLSRGLRIFLSRLEERRVTLLEACCLARGNRSGIASVARGVLRMRLVS